MAEWMKVRPSERLDDASPRAWQPPTGRVVLYAVLAAHVFFPLLWLVLVTQHGPLKNDWWHFRVVAEQFVAGEWGGLYSLATDSGHSGYFWRYPPFVLYVVAPLAWLAPSAAYAAVAGASGLALCWSLLKLAQLVHRLDRTAWALAILLSAPVLTTIITGQLSGVLLLIVVIAAGLWSQGRPVLACAVLGLLAMKPNLGVFFGLFALVRGEWRGALAMVGVVAALVATTIPLGSQLWVDFVDASTRNSAVLGQYDAYKQITVHGFLAGLFGMSLVTSALWFATVVLLLAAAVWHWRSAASIRDQLGMVVLLAIAANPYLSFYDAVLWALPATLWWTHRAQWRPRSWNLVGVLIAIVWLWEHLGHSWSPAAALAGWNITLPFSLVGPVSGIWLVIANFETRAQSAGRQPASACTV